MGCFRSRAATLSRHDEVAAELCERCGAFDKPNLQYCGSCGHLNVLCGECARPWISRRDPAPECTVCGYPMWEKT